MFLSNAQNTQMRWGGGVLAATAAASAVATLVMVGSPVGLIVAIALAALALIGLVFMGIGFYQKHKLSKDSVEKLTEDVKNIIYPQTQLARDSAAKIPGSDKDKLILLDDRMENFSNKPKVCIHDVWLLIDGSKNSIKKPCKEVQEIFDRFAALCPKPAEA